MADEACPPLKRPTLEPYAQRFPAPLSRAEVRDRISSVGMAQCDGAPPRADSATFVRNTLIRRLGTVRLCMRVGVNVLGQLSF